MHARSLFTSLLTAALSVAPLASAAAPALEGKVILTRVSADALVVWDATDRVVTLETAKTPMADIAQTLEAESATAAVSMLDSLGSAKTVTVRVVYQKTGAVSPEYGNASLQGVERLFAITYPIANLAAKAPGYADAFHKGTTPSGVTVTTLGKLPG
jgi:hypothetical protein